MATRSMRATRVGLSGQGGTCPDGFWDVNGDPNDGCEYGPCTPTGVEICDGTDNDCNGTVDEAPMSQLCPTPPGAALADNPRGYIVDLHKANWSGSLSPAAVDYGSLGTQAGEGKACPSTGLLDEGRVAQCLKDAVSLASHIVRDRENETRGQLP